MYVIVVYYLVGFIIGTAIVLPLMAFRKIKTFCDTASHDIGVS